MPDAAAAAVADGGDDHGGIADGIAAVPPVRRTSGPPKPKDAADVKPPAKTLSRADCKALYKEHGNAWNNLKTAFKSNPDTMWQLWLFRQDVVDKAMNDLKAMFGDFDWEAVGSKDLESDYDISVMSHGRHKDGSTVYDFQIVKAFNDSIMAEFGVQPGTLFDTNLYASAPPAQSLDKAGAGEDADPTSTAAMQKMAEQGQDVGALMKQRRYMDWQEYDDYAKEIVAKIEATGDAALAKSTRKQFEEADDLYQMSLRDVVDKGRDLLEADLKMLRAMAEQDEERIATTEKTLAWLNEELAKIEALGAANKHAEGQKALIALNHQFEHEYSDLQMRTTNEMYVKAVAKVRALEEKVHGLDTDDPDYAEKLNGLLALTKTMGTDAVFYANEAYHSEGPFKHIVEATQTVRTNAKREHPDDTAAQQTYINDHTAEALAALSVNQFLQSFNEQLGDFVKDLAHYGSEPFPGMGFYRSSKYMDRLLDALVMLKTKMPNLDVSIEGIADTPGALQGKVTKGLLAARKGRLDFIDGDNNPLKGEELQTEIEAFAIEEATRIYGVGTLDALGSMFKKLGQRINADVRASGVLAMETTAAEEAAYFKSAPPSS